MKFLIVFSCILAVAFAKPGYLGGFAAILPGAPIGADGRVVDTAEVSLAKAEHAAAHVNEKLNLNQEALRSADYFATAPAALSYAAPAALPYAAPAALPYAAPAALPYAAAAAPLAYSSALAYSSPLAYSAPAAALPIAASPYGYASQATILAGDGRPLDTPEVALAKASHAAAHINDKLIQAQEATRNLAFY